MFARVITIGGEYGSGRGEIAARVANRLGWRLVDNCLIEEIARTARIKPEEARQLDEICDPWFHRLRKALWLGGFEGVATTAQPGFDADALASIAQKIIEEAANNGRCIIVGRGAQCILQERRDAFHVFVYGPRRERIERVRKREEPGADAAELVDAWDRRREAYIRRHFAQDWKNNHLYHLMVCSSIGEEAAAEAILAAIEHQELSS
jgi:cytidylate kinase